MATEPSRPESDAELFRRLARPRLRVRGSDRSWPLTLGYVALAAIAVFVFVSLSRARTARTRTAIPAVATTAAAPAPVTSLIPQPAAPIVATTVPIGSPIPTPGSISAGPLRPVIVQAPSPGAIDANARLHAPAVIVDLLRPDATANSLTTTAAPPIAAPPPPGATTSAAAAPGTRPPSDEQFASRVAASRAETVAATRLASTATVAPQGTVIPAVLEGGLNSSLPGYVRALVSRDVRGFDGTTVLIPRGTRLIGEYKSGVAVGQSRAFVVWSRLLTPDGVSIDIGSPAIDTLGRGGIQGEANTHFLRRFGAAVLLSVLTAGLEAGVNHFSPNNSTVVIGTPQQANNVAAIALQRDIDIPTTITVPQGTAIRVFVARDLDFAGALPSAPAER